MMQVNLSTSSFKRVISIVLAFALFFIIGCIYDFVLVDNSTSELKEVMSKTYNPNEDYSAVVVGSSHAKVSFLDDIYEENTGENFLNMGSNLQCLDGSLALIKEANKNNNIKKVYLELFYWIAMQGNYKERTELTGTYIVYDSMRPSLDKYKYLFDSSSKEYWINGLIPARRYNDKIIDLEHITNTISYKIIGITPKKKAKQDKSSFEWQEWSSAAKTPVSLDQNTTDWKKSLNDIIKYCYDENIKLYFVVTPEPDISIMGVHNYDDYIDYLKMIANDNEVVYLDFNLVRRNMMDTSDVSLFKDGDHLNEKGAKIFSEMFSKYINGGLSYDDIFYSSYQDKVYGVEKNVFGLAGPLYSDENFYKTHLITNITEDKLAIEIFYNNGDVETVKLNNPYENFYFERNRHGIMKVIDEGDNRTWEYKF